MLDHDRTASMRSVKEIDSIQRKNSGQVISADPQSRCENPSSQWQPDGSFFMRRALCGTRH